MLLLLLLPMLHFFFVIVACHHRLLSPSLPSSASVVLIFRHCCRRCCRRRRHQKLLEAEDLFLSKLQGVSDPESKRKIIGSAFIDLFQAEANKIKGADFLLQVLETCGRCRVFSSLF